MWEGRTCKSDQHEFSSPLTAKFSSFYHRRSQGETDGQISYNMYAMGNPETEFMKFWAVGEGGEISENK